MPKFKEHYNAEINMTLMEMGNSSVTDISKYITSIRLIKDYNRYLFPFFEVNLKLPTNIYLNIANNDSNYYNLNIRLINTTDENQVYETYLNTVLKPYDNDKAVDLYVTPDANIDDDATESDVIPKHDYQMIMIDNKRANAFNKIINRCYSNTNLYNIVLNIFDRELTNYGDIIVEPFDNTKKYETILIPPLSLKNTIDFLDETYGIYNTGSMLYFDTDSVYLIRRNGDINISENISQLININIVKRDEGGEDPRMQGMFYYSDDDLYEYITTSTPIIINRANTALKSLGEKIIVSEYDDDFNKVKRVINIADNEDGQKVKYYWNSYGEDIAINKMISRAKEISDVTRIVFSGVHPQRLNPINRFAIKINNQYDEYRIMSTITTFIKQGDIFEIVNSGDFIKKRNL